MQLDFLYINEEFINYAFRFTKSYYDAQDIIQDVALKLLIGYDDKTQDELQKISKVAIKNRFIDLKRTSKVTYELFEHYTSPVESFEKRLLQKEKLNNVYKKLELMPRSNTKVFNLSVEGYTVFEIRDLFRENVNTILGKIFRVRNLLKKSA
jgi:DNA-directed RNA polymerase specialized sigma24 family protein